ncbi:MAG: HNH endonuclease [Methanobacterium sp.]
MKKENKNGIEDLKDIGSINSIKMGFKGSSKKEEVLKNTPFKFRDIKHRMISAITLKDEGSLIQTEGMVVSATDFYPELVEKAYACDLCSRLHIKTRRDRDDPQVCMECGGPLITKDLGCDFIDFKELQIQDLSNKQKNRITAYVWGEDVYRYYYEGDYVQIVAGVCALPRRKMALKIEDVKFRDITLLYKLSLVSSKNRGRSKTQKARSTKEYKEWRNWVLQRDGFKCQKCDEYTDDLLQLEAHHIYDLSSHPHRAYDVDNGITLCEKCHKLFHKIYEHLNGPYELDEFLRLNQYIEE